MQQYGSNKLRTAWQIIRRVDNWPTAFDLRLRKSRPGLKLLSFRNGLNVVCRGGTRDWDVLHELLFAGSYARAFSYLRALEGAPTVIDLGGNIGTFSLLAAVNHPRAVIHAYEPGPPNYRLFEMNRLANPALAERIHLCKEAVGGQTRVANWFFDAENPGGSGLNNNHGSSFQVQIRAWADVLRTIPGTIALAKIDIEGAEFELLQNSPHDVWDKINAISLELHTDPGGKNSPASFLREMADLGFTVEEEAVCSFFLYRP
jgi:FkbM family methyltransferase